MEDDLFTTFECFRRNRAALENLLDEVKNALTDVSKLESTKLDLKQLLLSTGQENEVRRIFQDPRLVFIGQTNAGKSSLINEVLGVTVLKADDVPCTWCMTELAYGPHEKPVVTIEKTDGSKTTTTSKTSYIYPPGFAHSPEGARTDRKVVGMKIYAEIDNAFLRSGVRIVDSPGLNENTQLDGLVKDHMGSALPMVVYVIDGKSTLTSQDIEDIRCLRQTIPTGNIFFVVTKCDNPAFMEDGDNSDDDSDDKGQAGQVDRRLRPTRLETDIRNRVYRKLVLNGFVDDVAMDECVYYHTISSRYVKKYRNASKIANQDKETMKECERFMIGFQNFKVSLRDFTRQQLIETVKNATEIIRLSLVKYLDYFVGDFNKAKELSISNEQSIDTLKKKQQNMKIIQADEMNLWGEIKSKVEGVKEEYIVAADDVVKRRRDEIIQLAAEMKMEVFVVQSDGYVHSDILNQRAVQLADNVMDKVGSMIHDEVVNKNGTISKLFNDISALVEELQAKIDKEKNIKSQDALQLMLASQFNTKQAIIKQSLWRRTLDCLKSIVKSFLSKKKVKFDESTWRETVVAKQLEITDTKKLAEAVVEGILEHLKTAHNGFCKQLRELQKVTEERLKAFQKASDENIRELKSGRELRETTPRMGRLLLMAWDIVDRSVRLGRIHPGKLIDAGSRGAVFECDAKGQGGEVCAVKVMTVKDAEVVGEIGLRLHCYRKISNEYLAEVFAVQLKHMGENGYELSILMPRLERNLLHALPRLDNLLQRLIIARQLNDDDKVKLTDYIEPAVGLPIHIAPEISSQQCTAKADVYSFGVLLWCVCKGEGTSVEQIKPGSKRRLEKTAGMRDDCWKLIANCSSLEPDERPSMEDVTRELIAIIEDVGRRKK